MQETEKKEPLCLFSKKEWRCYKYNEKQGVPFSDQGSKRGGLELKKYTEAFVTESLSLSNVQTDLLYLRRGDAVNVTVIRETRALG